MMERLFGWVSFAFTTIGATWLAFFGDSVWPWIVYIVAAVSGIVHNHREKNGSMTITFAFYLAMNVVALVRNIWFWWG